MALTSAGKDYIATNFGSGTPKCYVASGLSWTYLGTDGNTYPESGGTAQIVSRLVMTALVTSLTIGGSTYTNADLVAGNGGTPVTLDDAQWVAAHDEPSDSPPNPYCIGAPPTGKGTLYLATDPYCCSAWIDADPAVDPVTVACTKDKTLGEWDSIELDAPGTHTIHVRKTGYDNYYNEFTFVAEGQSLAELPVLKPEAGTDVALLTVNAYKEEEKPNKVPVENAVFKKGASKVGFCPYSESWRAVAAGTNYSISVVAEGRATYEEDIVLYKDTPKTIDAYLAEKKLEIVIKISPGVAYIDDISGGDYQVWYVNSLVEGWVRVETYLEEPTLFKAELTFCNLGTTTPAAGISKIVTEEKLLHSSMSASDRHLDWPSWLVPDRPGEYSLVAELFFMT